MIRLAETDDADSVWKRNVAEQVQSLVQISDGNPPHFVAAGIIGDQRGLEIEVRRPLEGEPAFADVALILSGIARDSRRLSVYTI